MIRSSTPLDKPSILEMIEASGHFDSDAVQFVQNQLEHHFDIGGRGIWLTADDGEVVGVAHCNPEPLADGTWNLLMLWTKPGKHRQGYGTALVRHVVDHLKTEGARLLIVETSGVEAFEQARAFYAKCGFQLEARIHNFFAVGDDKLVFTMALPSSA